MILTLLFPIATTLLFGAWHAFHWSAPRGTARSNTSKQTTTKQIATDSKDSLFRRLLIHSILSACHVAACWQTVNHGDESQHVTDYVLLLTLPTFWRPATILWSRCIWPRLVMGSGTWRSNPIQHNAAAAVAAIPETIHWMIRGGPLGPGLCKLWEAGLGVAWIVLCSLKDPHNNNKTTIGHADDEYLQWGPMMAIVRQYPWMWCCGLIGLTLVIHAVLWIWSTVLQTRGRHPGIQDTVSTTQGRALTIMEHASLLVWAVVNAVNEEITSRGVWRTLFTTAGRPWIMLATTTGVWPFQDPFIHLQWYSNIAQAITFGLAHYYGIPSGWTGVVLTALFGFIMAILQDVGHGLAWPILVHAVADYYIFAVIARRPTLSSSSLKQS